MVLVPNYSGIPITNRLKYVKQSGPVQVLSISIIIHAGAAETSPIPEALRRGSRYDHLVDSKLTGKKRRKALQKLYGTAEA